MTEIQGTRDVKVKTDEELMEAPDLQFMPNIRVIEAILNFYEGYSESKEKKGENLIKTEAGGAVFMATELYTALVARNIIIDPPEKYYLDRDLKVPEPMADDVKQYILDYMKPLRAAKRKAWTNPWKRSVRHAFLTGGFFLERWFKHQKWDTVGKQMMEAEGVPGIPMDDSGSPISCDNIIQRQFKNLIINRSYDTGLMLEKPFWVRRDQSETCTATDYIGPLHERQGCYGILHKQTETDYYGISIFAPLLSELKNSAKAYHASLAIARDTIVPVPMIFHSPGLSKDVTTFLDEQLKAFQTYTDVTKFRKGMRIPGGTDLKLLETKMHFDEIARFQEQIQDQIMIWLGIPITLIAPRSNYAVSRIQGKLFEQKINNYRDILWEAWENTHFRPLLLEKEVEDWETTPINVGWEVFQMEWDKDSPQERAKEVVDNEPVVQKAVKQLERGESPITGLIP